jgi:hypothetical protein
VEHVEKENHHQADNQPESQILIKGTQLESLLTDKLDAAGCRTSQPPEYDIVQLTENYHSYPQLCPVAQKIIEENMIKYLEIFREQLKLVRK